jgi:diguanylate cyclase (GGDEF)-like protein
VLLTAQGACRLSAAFVGTVGALVLVGWRADLTTLKSVFHGMPAMNPVTAVCFILAACSLALLAPARAPPWAARLGLGLSLAICGIATTKLASMVLGNTGAGVDQLLFTAALSVDGAAPNRMAPNTAVNFLLLGTALCVLRRPGHWSTPTRPLTMAAALVAYVALLGYAYRAGSLTRVSSFIPMALPTACCFLVLAAGVFLAAPDQNALGVVTRDTPGGRLLRRLTPLMLGVPPLLGWLRLQAELAGLLGATTGVALMVVVMIVMGLGFAFWNAIVIDARDRDRRGAEQAVLKLAHYDALTGLPNRILFNDRLQQALAHGARHGRQVALLYLDLDHFKRINDTLGHGAGDRVLAEAANRLRSCIRDTDTVARLGGDEFTGILTEVADLDAVRRVTERMLHMLAAPFEIDGRELRVSASIGVALSVLDGHAPDELLRRADEALYRAKLKRNRCEFYSDIPESSRRAPAASTGATAA